MAGNIIYNPDKLSRIVSFSGLPHVGPCSPTDIDFCIEVGSMRRYMVGDLKESGKPLTTGQRILLERNCDAFTSHGYLAVAFLAWHPPDDTVIDAASALVVQKYLFGEWVDCEQELETVKQKYLRFFGLDKTRQYTEGT